MFFFKGAAFWSDDIVWPNFDRESSSSKEDSQSSVIAVDSGLGAESSFSPDGESIISESCAIVVLSSEEEDGAVVVCFSD